MEGAFVVGVPMLDTRVKRRRVAAACALTLSSILGYAYATPRSADPPLVSVVVNPPRDVAAEGFDRSPRGRWRLAPLSELARVVLFPSPILLRQEKSAPGEAPFSAPEWRTQPPPPARPREAALAIARDIAATAQRDPRNFAQLARERSEDMLTRERGGVLGPRSPGHFMMQDGILRS